MRFEYWTFIAIYLSLTCFLRHVSKKNEHFFFLSVMKGTEMWVTRTYLTLSIRKKMEVKTGYAMNFKTSDKAKNMVLPIPSDKARYLNSLLNILG